MMTMNAPTVPLVPQKQIEDLASLILLLENKDVIKERLQQLSDQQATIEKIRADSTALLQTARQAHEDSLKAQEGLNHRREILEAREEEVKHAEAAVKIREEAITETEKSVDRKLVEGASKLAADRAKLNDDQAIIVASNKDALNKISAQMIDLNLREKAVAAEEARVKALAAEIEGRLNMIKNAAMGPLSKEA
jgi:hypothetical protein